MSSLKEKLEKEQNQIKRLQKLLEKFPDLEEQKDRWGNIYLCSATVNPIVDKVYTKRSCGCCSDAPYYSYLYTEIDGERIYSNPKMIVNDDFVEKTEEQKVQFFTENNLNMKLLPEFKAPLVARKAWYELEED
jgi:hypothetical protein